MAQHYGTSIIPARPARPKDKAKAEAAVLMAQRWILAALRNRTFFSLAELNQAIREKLTLLNNRKFQKLDTSRAELFKTIEKPALKPLPAQPYEFARWKKATVNFILKNRLDQQTLPAEEPAPTKTVSHPNIRGSGYYH